MVRSRSNNKNDTPCCGHRELMVEITNLEGGESEQSIYNWLSHQTFRYPFWHIEMIPEVTTFAYIHFLSRNDCINFYNRYQGVTLDMNNKMIVGPAKYEDGREVEYPLPEPTAEKRRIVEFISRNKTKKEDIDEMKRIIFDNIDNQ